MIALVKNYKFKDRPLQTEEFYNILLIYSNKINCLRSNKPFQTYLLVKEIKEFHYANGGGSEFYEKAAFKALNKILLVKDSFLEKVKKGWYIRCNDHKAESVVKVKVKETRKSAIKDLKLPKAKKIIGTGNFFVYVLFDKKSICKIGKTNNPSARFKTLATGWPEMWEYITEVKFETKLSMNKYESIIHKILQLKKCKIIDSNKGGKEFFRITPIEINKIISSINRLVSIN